MRRRAIGSVLLLAACHAAAPITLSNSGSEVPLPAGLLHDAAALRPVLTQDGVSYLWLAYEWTSDATPAWRRAPAGCWSEVDGAARRSDCPSSVAVPAEALGTLPSLPTTLSVIGVDGPCTATIGAAVIIPTNGCEESVTVVAPLTGCPAEVAPLGLADAAFDGDLRWRARPASAPVAIGAQPPAPHDPVVARYAAQWLAEPLFAAASRHNAAMVSAQLDAGSESLTAIELAAVVGTDPDECQWQVEDRSVIGVRRGDVLTPLRGVSAPDADADPRGAIGGVPVDFDGAIFWRGDIAAVVSGAPTTTTVDELRSDGTVARVFDQAVWQDNAECTIRNWTGVSYPCGL
jgi:hypothetical protein